MSRIFCHHCPDCVPTSSGLRRGQASPDAIPILSGRSNLAIYEIASPDVVGIAMTFPPPSLRGTKCRGNLLPTNDSVGIAMTNPIQNSKLITYNHPQTTNHQSLPSPTQTPSSSSGFCQKPSPQGIYPYPLKDISHSIALPLSAQAGPHLSLLSP